MHLERQSERIAKYAGTLIAPPTERAGVVARRSAFVRAIRGRFGGAVRLLAVSEVGPVSGRWHDHYVMLSDGVEVSESEVSRLWRDACGGHPGAKADHEPIADDATWVRYVFKADDRYHDPGNPECVRLLAKGTPGITWGSRLLSEKDRETLWAERVAAWYPAPAPVGDASPIRDEYETVLHIPDPPLRLPDEHRGSRSTFARIGRRPSCLGCPPPPDAETTFERMPNEPPLAWGAFVLYRDLGPARTLETVRKTLGKEAGYLHALERWSRAWRWGQRCLKWDAWLDAKTREAAAARMPLWEQRRQESLERNLEVAARLRDQLREMMDHPITRETTKEVGGREVTVIEPARWNWSTIIAGIRMVAELEAATIAEGLLEADDDFDIEAATVEQLKAFVGKHRPRRGGPPSAPPG